VATAELAAAVSNAGGLGVIGGVAYSPDVLRAEIRKVRSLTSKPFGVDLLLAPNFLAPQSGARNVHAPRATRCRARTSRRSSASPRRSASS
jgi:NAD(P)H-dependent flavin oxidoreductase YrpB (nitropropane dioxygenase family)